MRYIKNVVSVVGITLFFEKSNLTEGHKGKMTLGTGYCHAFADSSAELRKSL